MDAGFESFDTAGDREEGETGRVEGGEDPRIHDVGRGMEDKDERSGEDGHGGVTPVADRAGRDGADEEVAEDAAAESGDKGQDDDAQEIEVDVHGGGGALRGEERGADQVDREEEVSGVEFHGSLRRRCRCR